MAVLHSTTAFVKAIKESADILKKNIAVIYVKDPFDSPSEGEEEEAPPEEEEQKPRPDEFRFLQEETVQESRKVAVQEDSDDNDSEDKMEHVGADDQFLQFEVPDLLNENTAEFNLELSKAQVGRLFSSLRVEERIEAAKDMDSLMEFLESLQVECDSMLDDTEAVTEAAFLGLQEKRQDISTLVHESRSKIAPLLKGFLEKVAQYRADTMDSLRARFTRSAYDEFWDGLQDTIDRQSRRRRSEIDEEHVAEVTAEQQKRLTASQQVQAADNAPAKVGAGAVAAKILEAISLQQDETAYRKTRADMETEKMQQYLNLVQVVEAGADDGEDPGKLRGGLSAAEVELLARVRTDARKEACEKVLNTPEGQRLAEKAGGKDFEDPKQVEIDCRQLEHKARELEKELKNTSTQEERIQELEKTVSAKKTQLERIIKRNERKARMLERLAGNAPDTNEPDESQGPDVVPLIQQLVEKAPEMEETVVKVHASLKALKAEFLLAKDEALNEKMESAGVKPDNLAASKVEVLQERLEKVKNEFQFLVEEKTKLEEELKPKPSRTKDRPLKESRSMKKAKTAKSEELEPPQTEDPQVILQWSSTCPQTKYLFDTEGTPILSEEVPDVMHIRSVLESKPYLAALTKACRLLEARRASLSKRLRTMKPDTDFQELGLFDEKAAAEAEAAQAEQEAAEEELARRNGILHPSQDTRQGASGPAGTAAERTGRPGVGGRGGGATPTGAKNAGESPRRGSVGGEAAAGRPPMSRLEREKLRKGRPPPRPTRKGRMAIFGALSPMQAQSEVTEEAKASVMALLKMAQELEELRAKVRHLDSRIHRAKNADGKKGSSTRNLEEDDDDAPDENRDLRKEVQRQQRELNGLRKRWADEKGGREKNVQRQNAWVGTAVRQLIVGKEAPPVDESTSSSSSSSASDSSG